MVQEQLLISESDKAQLEEFGGGSPHQGTHSLREELQRATVVAPEQMPSTIVTMNSEVVLRDIESDEQMTLSLVYPDDADLAAGALSVLAPVGTAILGASEGTVVEWPVPSGTTRIAIEKVLHQPEASGDA